MAEKATKEIPGASKHIVRMEKGRQMEEKERRNGVINEKKGKSDAEIESKESAEVHLQESKIRNTKVRENVIDIEKKRKRYIPGEWGE